MLGNFACLSRLRILQSCDLNLSKESYIDTIRYQTACIHVFGSDLVPNCLQGLPAGVRNCPSPEKS